MAARCSVFCPAHRTLLLSHVFWPKKRKKNSKKVQSMRKESSMNLQRKRKESSIKAQTEPTLALSRHGVEGSGSIVLHREEYSRQPLDGLVGPYLAVVLAVRHIHRNLQPARPLYVPQCQDFPVDRVKHLHCSVKSGEQGSYALALRREQVQPVL